jgi:urea transporter
MPEKESEQANEDSVKNAATAADAVNPAQIKCMMVGIALIIFINLVLTIVAVVLGLQIKSEIDALEEELAPVMEMMDGITGGGDGGSGGASFPPP